MTAEDLLVMAGMGAFPALLALAACGIFLVPRPRWLTVGAFVLVGVMAASLLIYGVTWGWAFDYADADADRPVPGSLDRTNIASGLLFAAAFVLFLASSLLAAVLAWRRRRDQPDSGNTSEPRGNGHSSAHFSGSKSQSSAVTAQRTAEKPQGER